MMLSFLLTTGCRTLRTGSLFMLRLLTELYLTAIEKTQDFQDMDLPMPGFLHLGQHQKKMTPVVNRGHLGLCMIRAIKSII